MIKLWGEEIPGYNPEISNEIPTMIPYLVKDEKNHGVVIIFPGGGYNHRAYHEGEPVAKWLNSIGISAFVVNYRVSPYKYPYPLMDAKRAVRYIRYNANKWNIDSNKIAVLGFSAGGHLAASVGTHFDAANKNSDDVIEKESSRPDALILCYPVITFGEFSHRGTVINLLGENSAQDLINSLSNEKMVTSNTPPSFIWHTANDNSVPVENSLLFSKALSKNNVPFEMHIFPNGRHGLGMAEELPDVSIWTNLCERWLKKLGY